MWQAFSNREWRRTSLQREKVRGSTWGRSTGGKIVRTTTVVVVLDPVDIVTVAVVTVAEAAVTGGALAALKCKIKPTTEGSPGRPIT